MDITLTFLGTSNAFPTKERNHPSLLLQWKDQHILFDCGEGTQRQFKKAHLNPCKLTKLFITHLHGDHVLGIPGLLKTLEMSEYSRTLEIYGPRGLAEHMHTIARAYGPFNIKHAIHELHSTHPVNEPEYAIEARPLDHGIPTAAYTFIVKDKRRLDKAKLKKLKLPNSPLLKNLQQGKDITINGKKIKASSVSYEEKGKKVAIIMDTRMNDNAIEAAHNADLIICEATYANTEEAEAEHKKHLTAAQAATIAKKAKTKQLILTHISSRYEQILSILEKEAKKVFKNTKIAKDLDVVVIK